MNDLDRPPRSHVRATHHLLFDALVLLAALGFVVGPEPASARPNRFIILSDLHPHPDAYGQLDALTRHVGKLDPAFVVVLGDIANDALPGFSEREIEAVRTMFRRLRAAGIEIYPVMGNHDVHARVEDIKVRWFCEQEPMPLNRLFDASRDTDARRAFTRKGPYDYSFNRGGIHFAVLDSNCLPPRPGDASTQSARGDSRWQAHEAWMRADLCRHVNNPQRLPCIVFLHHPEYMNGERGMTERPLYRVLADCRDQHNVKAVFGGHWHYGQNFPPEQNLGIEVYATPASVHPKDGPVEFVVADVTESEIMFQPRDSVTGEIRTGHKPVRYAPIRGRFGDLRAEEKRAYQQ